MFTGLIEDVGDVTGVDTAPGGLRLQVRAGIAGALAEGESLAVNGVCLTMRPVGADTAVADIGPETIRVTTLGGLRPGDRVNLERAMRADARFGGHLVQGHVDGTATVEAVRPDGDAHWITLVLPEALAAGVITKGSIAVDGVSLTVAALRPPAIDLMIIPFTWAHTTLARVRPGMRVNVECDMIGKYVAAHLARQQSGS